MKFLMKTRLCKIIKKKKNIKIFIKKVIWIKMTKCVLLYSIIIRVFNPSRMDGAPTMGGILVHPTRINFK